MRGSEGQQKKMSCRSEVSVWENRLRPWKNFHPPFPVESTPIPFLIGINGSFTVHIYAFMQHQTAILHKIRAFRAFRCILCNFKKFFKKVAFLFKIKVFISCCMVLYTQVRKQVLTGGVKAHTYSREVSQLPISKAFLLYFPMGIFSSRFLTPIPHIVLPNIGRK